MSYNLFCTRCYKSSFIPGYEIILKETSNGSFNYFEKLEKISTLTCAICTKKYTIDFEGEITEE